MEAHKHWAESLKSGANVKGTIRHPTDGKLNRINVDLVVRENFPTERKIIAKDLDTKENIIVPYNELTKIQNP